MTKINMKKIIKKMNSLFNLFIRQGDPTTIFGKYLFGRRFAI